MIPNTSNDDQQQHGASLAPPTVPPTAAPNTNGDNTETFPNRSVELVEAGICNNGSNARRISSDDGSKGVEGVDGGEGEREGDGGLLASGLGGFLHSKSFSTSLSRASTFDEDEEFLLEYNEENDLFNAREEYSYQFDIEANGPTQHHVRKMIG